MKEVLAIHEITPEILNIPKETLAKYVLTFDDGLYSQYLYWDFFKDIPTEKIFFITPKALHEGNESDQIEDISSAEAHQLFFEFNSTKAFMSLDQLGKLRIAGVTIGGHSFEHTDQDTIAQLSLEHKFKLLKYDTEKMTQWFKRYLDLDIKHFCYPYNNDYSGLYTVIVKSICKDVEIYGNNRHPIESLI